MKALAWPLLLLLPIPAAWAQSGVLTGSAFDSHRQPIAAAKVYLQRAGEKQIQSARTDSSGVYHFTVAAGNYTVRVEDSALGQASAGPVSITPDKVTTLDLVIQAQYFDEPQFTVAGVTDNTYRGGHGSDTVLRSAEGIDEGDSSSKQPECSRAHGPSVASSPGASTRGGVEPKRTEYF